MSLPGYTADHAIAPVILLQTTGRSVGRLGASAMARGAPAEWFWPCFRNCYDRCGGEGPGHTDWCFSTCYYLCNWNPTIVF
jgi:hypothetical protein